jgi:hypothetical protein
VDANVMRAHGAKHHGAAGDRSATTQGPHPRSWKAGQRGNPKGRPRRGDALAEAIRAQVSPDELIAVARAVIADAKAPASVKLQGATFLAERGYARPVERHELLVDRIADDDEDAALDGLTLEQLDELEKLELRRIAILAERAALDAGVIGAAVDASPDEESVAVTRGCHISNEESRG